MNTPENTFQRHLSPVGGWAIALGTSVGWGSMFITSNTYLPMAGPLGSVLGMLVGAAVMLLISCNYGYMASCYPDSGGAYTYTKKLFGYDHGFLVSWFLALTYLAMLLANATALPLFAGYFVGDVFKFGRLYTLFDYDVYLGEALLSIGAILLIALITLKSTRASYALMIALAAVFILGIGVNFAFSLFKSPSGSFSPAFVPDKNALGQVMKIAVISPWAFIGFENISHSAEEVSFKHTRFRRVLLIAVVSTTLLYVFVTLLSASAYPENYDSWLSYIANLDREEGLNALPAFYAANRYLGSFGVTALMISLLALIITSLIGNILALSRLFCALGRDRILPEKVARIDKNGVPSRAILLICALSAVVPFVGRNAVVWIVDVTTLGAMLVYGFVSACAYRQARLQRDKLEQFTGMGGLIVMLGFGLYVLVSNLFTSGSIETESYFLFVVWALLGFFYFRMILHRDREKRFGKSIIVWIALLSLILFVSMVWMSRSMTDATNEAMRRVQAYYTGSDALGESGIVAEELRDIRLTNARSVIVVAVLFGIALAILINNYTLMSRRAEKSEQLLGAAREMANTDSLTGVKSKHAYAEAEKAINLDLQSGKQTPLAVVVCDVNGLKFINDTFGHAAGDEHIRKAAAIICSFFDHSPVYRTGGDEFTVLLRGQDYDSREQILSALHEQSVSNIAAGEVVISAGLSELKADDARLHSAFERADKRMYEEKQLLKSLGAKTRG